MSTRGIFVTLEGGEGAGKSTQAQLLAEHLRNAGHETLVLREPGGTPLGEGLRRLLLFRPAAISDRAELQLFLAARAQLVATVIRPALDAGQVVICDRFADSTIAYQGYGRGLDIAEVRRLNDWATAGLTPDLTILLDLTVEEGSRRKHGDDDTFIREGATFHEAVRRGYLAMAAEDPGRWLVLDGSLSPDALSEAIAQRVAEVL